MSIPRSVRLVLPLLCAPLLAACASTTTGNATPADAPAATSATSESAAPAAGPSATVQVSGDSRADRDGEYEVTGSPDADTTCDAGTEQVTVEVREESPTEGQIAYVYVRGPVGTAGPGTVVVEFQSEEAFGVNYDSDYTSSDGRSGSATSEATVDGDQVTVTFEATIWDGATITGTATCTAEA
jgi:hypothetical protein